MKASDVLKKEIIYKWAEEIVKEIEEDSILILKYDLVVTTWLEEINKLISMVKIKNACTRLTCPKSCPTCVNVIDIIRKEKRAVCINCKSLKLLYVKVSEMRYHPVKLITIGREVAEFFEEAEDVDIIDANESKVFLPPKLYSFIKTVDREYLSPVLIVRMLRYLEHEKSARKNRNIDEIIHGLRVSFLFDPVHIETTRLNLYRQNKAEKQAVSK
ncbi:hypothetical protein NEMIN01_2103 [Nematocida minor]|uniref:uncharacterized protein n=1 Tax=Nematocida minor TaxID=1912983 RepID=UPI002220A809|nr:uncharacterized protein NEMIN01_2103 [Nematocida minor]KAI5192590.1 hypothetical protein NEMIN01_2103 [Nematocida minor]